MKNYRILAALLALAAALAISASPARAQAVEAAAAAAPIVSKVISTVTAKKKPQGSNWLKAEVIHADANSIIVREQANSLAIHTFTYSPQIKDAMQQLEDQGGYQYGDKVKILREQGKAVALAVRGKPSKPL